MPPTIRDLLPVTNTADNSKALPRVVGIDDDAADEVFDVLGSTTARTLYAAICEEPQPPANLAAHVETSSQNVHHHLNRLEEAGLITPVGTTYSEKGVEMTVYGSAHSPLVVTNADESRQSILREALKRLFAGISGLIILSLVVQRLSELIAPTHHPSPPPGMSANHAFTPPPGLVVFAVGVPIIVVFVLWWAYRASR